MDDQLAQFAATLAQNAPDILAASQPARGRDKARQGGSQKRRQPEPNYTSEEWDAAAALLSASLLGGGEIGGREIQQDAPRGGSQHTGPELEEIATQLLSAIPEFAELLNTRSGPAQAPERPLQGEQQHQQQQHQQRPPQVQHDHQLDATQQQLLQQLIMSVTQQQQDADAQQLSQQLQQQERMAMLQKQEQQMREHMLQQQLQSIQQQQQQQQQQQKAQQAQQQAQQQALLQAQQQALAMQRASSGTGELMQPTLNVAALTGGGISRDGRGLLDGSAGFSLAAAGGDTAAAAAAVAAALGRQTEPPHHQQRGGGWPDAGTAGGAAHPGASVPAEHLSSSADKPAAATAAASGPAAAARSNQQWLDLLGQHQAQLQPDPAARQQQRQAAAEQDRDQREQHRPEPSDSPAALPRAARRGRGLRRRASSPSPSASLSDTPADSSEAEPPAAETDLQRQLQQDLEQAATAQAAAAAAAAACTSLRARLGLPVVGLGCMAGALQGPAPPSVPEKAPPPKNKHAVFVWDLDETLILLHSLVTGRLAVATDSVEQRHAAELGRRMQRQVLRLSDEQLHFKQLEDVDLVHSSDVWRLAAHHKQRVSRRARQQAKQQQQQQQQENGGDDDDEDDGDAVAPRTDPAKGRGAGRPAVSGPQAGGDGAAPAEASEAATAMEVDASAAVANGTCDAGKASGPITHQQNQQEQPNKQDKQQQDKQTHEGQPEQRKRQADAADAPAKADSSPTPATSSGGGRGGQAGAAGDQEGAAAADVAALAAQLSSCVVVGAPGAPPEPELVLRPFKLGPPPEQLKSLWQDVLKVYDAGSGVLPLPKAELLELELLYEDLDAASSGWLRAAADLLRQLSSRPELLVTHVVVGDSQLVPLLAKLLLFRLDGSFALDAVYSAAAAAKAGCFRRIAAKYGPKARYIVVGDGLEEEACAELMDWPFVRITLNSQPADAPPQAAAADAPAVAAREPPDAVKRRKAGGTAVDAAADADGGSGVGRAKASSPAAAADAAARQESAGTRCRPAAGSGSGSGSGREDGDGDDAGEVSQRQKNSCEASGAEQHKACAAGQAARHAAVRRDALGSPGHTLLELTADQLMGLALALK